MHAIVACVRNVEDGRGDELDRSLPFGDIRIRVGSWEEVFWERKVVKRFVRSIVCDMALIGIGLSTEEVSSAVSRSSGLESCRTLKKDGQGAFLGFPKLPSKVFSEPFSSFTAF